jgi:hypothetical protein
MVSVFPWFSEVAACDASSGYFGIWAVKRKIHFKTLSGFSLVRAVTGFYINLVFLRCNYRIQNLFSNVECLTLNKAVVMSVASLLLAHRLFQLNPK